MAGMNGVDDMPGMDTAAPAWTLAALCGNRGALVMGLCHGLFCIGCCAALMLLLFGVAVMDLRWVAVLAVLVSAEKLLPHPRLWRRAIAAALIAAAAAVLLMQRLI